MGAHHESFTISILGVVFFFGDAMYLLNETSTSKDRDFFIMQRRHSSSLIPVGNVRCLTQAILPRDPLSSSRSRCHEPPVMVATGQRRRALERCPEGSIKSWGTYRGRPAEHTPLPPAAPPSTARRPLLSGTRSRTPPNCEPGISVNPRRLH